MSNMRSRTQTIVATVGAAAVATTLSLPLWAQQRGTTPQRGAAATRPAPQTGRDQWVNYQQNSNFSPLSQITPENVSRLTRAWTFSYGGGSQPSGNLGLDYRFEVQPL